MKTFPSLSLFTLLALVTGITSTQAQTLEEALDTTGQVWTSTGWAGTTSVSHDSIDSAASPDVDPVLGDDVHLETTVTGPMVVTFWWRLDTDNEDAHLGVESVGTDVAYLHYEDTTAVDGEWVQGILVVDADAEQEVTLRWTFTQAPGSSGNPDKAYLDDVKFYPIADALPVPYYYDELFLEEFPPFYYGVELGTNNFLSFNVFSETGTINPVEVDLEIDGIPYSSTNLSDQGFNYWSGYIEVPMDGSTNGLYSATYTNENGSVEYLMDSYEAHAYGAALGAGTLLSIESFGTSIFRPVLNPEDGENALEVTVQEDGYTELSGYINGPGILRFRWKFEDPADLVDDGVEPEGVGVFAIGNGFNETEFRYLADNVNTVEGWQDATVVIYNYDTFTAGFSTQFQKDGAKLSVDHMTFSGESEGPVTIVREPVTTIAFEGSSVTFSTLAFGAGPLNYQWYDEAGVPIPDANGPDLILNGVDADDEGGYYCIVTGPGEENGDVSAIAYLTLLTPEEVLEYDSPWVFGGYAFWQPTLNAGETHDGVDGMVSPIQNVGEDAWVETTVQGPGIVSFWWRLDGEQNELYVEDPYGSSETVYYDETSPAGGQWARGYLVIDQDGPVTVRWTHYVYGYSSTPPRAYLDQVEFTPLDEAVPFPYDVDLAFESLFPHFYGFEPGESQLYFPVFSSEEPEVEWLRNGDPISLPTTIQQISGNYYYVTADFSVQTSNDGLYSIRLTNNQGFATYDLGTYEAHEYSEGLDAELDQVWSDGETIFRYQGSGGVDPGDDVVAMVADEGKNGTLSTYVLGPGTLTFWWKVDDPAEFDYAEGVFEASGTVDGYVMRELDSDYEGTWVKETIHLPRRQSYYLDWSLSEYHDDGTTLSIDQFSYVSGTEGPVRIVVQPENYIADVGADVEISCLAYGSGPLTYTWYNQEDEVVGTGPVLSMGSVSLAEAGTYYCVVTGSGDGNSATTQIVSLAVVEGELGGHVENTTHPWISFGPTPWGLVEEEGFTNNNSLRSGFIGDNQKTTLQGVVEGPAIVTFDYLVSSEENYDFLNVYLNGQKIQSFSGGTGTQTSSFYIPAGTNSVRFVYEKDPIYSDGSDGAWVDNIRIGPADSGALTIAEQPESVYADLGADVALTCQAVGPGTISYEWFNIFAQSVGTGPTLSIEDMNYADGNGYYCVVTNGSETVQSNIVDVAVVFYGAAVGYDVRPWISYGRDPWNVGSDQVYDGSASVNTSPIGPGESSRLIGTFQGPGTVNFWYKVDSEVNDRLRVYLNDVLKDDIGGDVDWQNLTLYLADGINTLRFEYTKDEDGDDGQDAAYVDGFNYVATKSFNDFLGEYSLTPGSPNTGADEDYDGDGVSNILEHLFRTSPVEASLGQTYLGYLMRDDTRRTAALAIPLPFDTPPDVHLEVLQSTTLANDSWEPLAYKHGSAQDWQFSGTPLIVSSGIEDNGVLYWIAAKNVQSNPPPTESAAPTLYLKLKATLIPPSFPE